MNINTTIREKDKGWQVIVSYKQGGKWKQKSKQGFRSEREAKNYSWSMIDEVKELIALETPEEFEDTTVEQFIKVYLEDCKIRLSSTTVGNYKYALRKLEDIYPKCVKDVKEYDILRIINKMRADKLANNTIVSYFRDIKIFFGIFS